MSAHVVLNLFNEMGKRDKMRGLLTSLINSIIAQMLDSIYHRPLRLL